MKTWIFAQPAATGSNGWAGKAIVAGLDLTSVDRAPAFYEDDARLIADAPRLKEENEQLKLQVEGLREENVKLSTRMNGSTDAYLEAVKEVKRLRADVLLFAAPEQRIKDFQVLLNASTDREEELTKKLKAIVALGMLNPLNSDVFAFQAHSQKVYEIANSTEKCEATLHGAVVEHCVHKCGHDLPCPFHP